jgi:predicted Zn-dependent peptidase
VRLTVTEIDGVATVWAQVAGPLRASLLVRAGTSDETLPTHGVTHLLEHLAMFGVGRPGDHSNGFVDATHTLFHVVGDDDLVTGFLDTVTRQLADPPAHRLDDERGVLAAESAGRSRGPWDEHLLWRYGATGYGLAGHEPFGERSVDAAALAAWSRRFATRGNAVLWLSGPPPAGLRLHLPDGERIPARDPRRTIVEGYPAWFTGPDDGVSLDAILPRDVASAALAHVLRARLVDDLRSRRAVAYSPDTGSHRLTGDTLRLVAHTDLVPGRQSEAVRPFLEALERLGEPDGPGAVRPEDVADWMRIRRQGDLEPTSGLAALHSAAWDMLHGLPPRPPAEVAALAEALTPAEVAAAAGAALGTALAQVPTGLAPRHRPWRAAPASLYPALTGRDYAALGGGPDAGTMTLADDGVTERRGDEHRTVPLAETVAVLRWADGGRVLVAADGNRLRVEPGLWRDGPDLVARIDAAWPPDVVVDLGTRPPDTVPEPAAAPREEPAWVWWLHGRLLGRRAKITLAWVAFAVFVVVWTVVADGDPPPVLPLLIGLGISAGLSSRSSRKPAPPERPAPPPETAERPQDRTAGGGRPPAGEPADRCDEPAKDAPTPAE